MTAEEVRLESPYSQTASQFQQHAKSVLFDKVCAVTVATYLILRLAAALVSRLLRRFGRQSLISDWWHVCRHDSKLDLAASYDCSEEELIHLLLAHGGR